MRASCSPQEQLNVVWFISLTSAKALFVVLYTVSHIPLKRWPVPLVAEHQGSPHIDLRATEYCVLFLVSRCLLPLAMSRLLVLVTISTNLCRSWHTFVCRHVHLYSTPTFILSRPTLLRQIKMQWSKRIYLNITYSEHPPLAVGRNKLISTACTQNSHCSWVPSHHGVCGLDTPRLQKMYNKRKCLLHSFFKYLQQY